MEGCIDDQRQCEPAVLHKQFSGDIIHSFATLKFSEFFLHRNNRLSEFLEPNFCGFGIPHLGFSISGGL